MSTWVLYLIRHAQSENNAKPDAERIPDPGITPLGVEQSERLAASIDRYRPTRLYCSPFLRSLQTLSPVAKKLQLQPRVRQDLYEQGGCHRGYVDGQRFAEPGMSRSEISVRFPDWHLDKRITQAGWNDLAGYEKIEQARRRAQRVKEWYEQQPDDHSDHRVAMMIHADFKVRLLEAFLGFDDLDPHIVEPINTSISCLIRENGRWRLDYWNHFHHLPTELVTS